MQYLVEGIGFEIFSCQQVDVFSKRKSPEVITLDDVVQLGVVFLESHHATAREHDFQFGIAVVAQS